MSDFILSAPSILATIVNHMDVKEILALAATSKKLNEIIHMIVKSVGCSKTKQMMLDYFMVSKHGCYLEFVENQTEAICIAAVKQNGWALKYVKHQTEAICLAAVSQYGRALKYVKNQTEAICIAAVSQNEYNLRFVEIQTEAICLAANNFSK